MNNIKNFLERDFNDFSERVHHAAAEGRIGCSTRLINTLIQAQEVARASAVVARMHIANVVQKDSYDDSPTTEEPPLGDYVMSALLGLVAFANEVLDTEINETAHWVEQHIVPPNQAPTPSGREKGKVGA